MPYKHEIKAIKLLQDRSKEIKNSHDLIFSDIESIKADLLSICGDLSGEEGFDECKEAHLNSMSSSSPMKHTNINKIYSEANAAYNNIGLADILSEKDFSDTQKRVNGHIQKFNQKYELDDWDYAIAGGCGLFAAMLDWLCVKAPMRPTTTSFATEVDGIFNQAVQKAFNTLIPPDLSSKLSEANPIGAPDASTGASLLDAPSKVLNPYNHRLKALSHDPVLGFIFGVMDMIRGTCTCVVDGKITTFLTSKAPIEGNVFQLLGRMLGHLLSDINAPSAKGNRGMGLPAPFMGILRMFDSIPVGDSTFGKQIEYMYVNGYDFRQFVVTSVPVSIMEITMRAFYVAKQMSLYKAGFAETILDTVPMKLNPRFRIMLAIGYGTMCAINSGKMYITQNILNANYSAWMGLVWNSFHALKWALYEKHLKLWGFVEEQELKNLQSLVDKIDQLETRATTLPI